MCRRRPSSGSTQTNWCWGSLKFQFRAEIQQRSGTDPQHKKRFAYLEVSLILALETDHQWEDGRIVSASSSLRMRVLLRSWGLHSENASEQAAILMSATLQQTARAQTKHVTQRIEAVEEEPRSVEVLLLCLTFSDLRWETGRSGVHLKDAAHTFTLSVWRDELRLQIQNQKAKKLLQQLCFLSLFLAEQKLPPFTSAETPQRAGIELTNPNMWYFM